jgi:prepilin-type N-terminal cleavage/methylation domain-containing protein
MKNSDEFFMGKPVMRNFQFSIFNFQFKKNLQPNRGFTLIELLIVIAVIFIIIGIIFSNYARFNQRQQLIGAGQTLENNLRDTQSRAYNGEMDCGVCDCDSTTTSLSGWYADFTAGNIYGVCKAPDGAYPTFSPQSLGLAANITVVPDPASRILFRYYPPGIDRSTTLCVSQAGFADNYYKISVYSSGDITDEGGLVGTCP